MVGEGGSAAAHVGPQEYVCVCVYVSRGSEAVIGHGYLVLQIGRSRSGFRSLEDSPLCANYSEVFSNVK